METARTGFFGVSSMTWVAGAAIIALIGSFFWQSITQKTLSFAIEPQQQLLDTSVDTAVGDHMPSTQVPALADASSYSALGTGILARAILAYDEATKNDASSEKGIAAVQKFAETLDPGVTFKAYSAAEISTSPDTSKDRVLSYRADLRTALEPLLANTENELDLFAQYVATKEPAHLVTLNSEIQNYQLAIANTERVVVPADAAIYHAAMLTALQQFSSTLRAMTENATDPVASTALLKTYLVAQDNMIASFNAIGSYAANKLL